MEDISIPFMNFMQSTPNPRSNHARTRAEIAQLLTKLEAYPNYTDFDKDPVRERAAAENLVKCLYHERIVLSDVEAREYVKIVCLVWEFEDQGYIPSSALINDLAIRTLLEIYEDIKCKSIVTSGLQHMFVTATQQNKRVLVDAVLLSATCQNARDASTFDLWEDAIVASIGKSSMRMEVVESSIVEKCTDDRLIGGRGKNSLLYCIASIASTTSLSFDWSKIRAVIIEQMHGSRGKTAIAYSRFFHDLFSVENTDPVYYINEYILFLKTAKRAQIDLQCSIYEAVDDLKQKMLANAYQEPFLKVFSEQWTNEQ